MEITEEQYCRIEPELPRQRGNVSLSNLTVLTGISFLAFRRLKIYTHLRPSEYNVFSERTISSERPFRGPLKPSNQHPNPAFSDNSPYLGDSGIVFLCAVAQAIPTGVPIHRSAPACWQTAVGSNGPRPAFPLQ